MNKRGIALILSFMVITVLTILGAMMILRSISERHIAQRYAESTQAFWLAEAGVNHALNELRNNWDTTSWTFLCPNKLQLGAGSYCVDVQAQGADLKVTAHGFVPKDQPHIERTLEVIITDLFFKNAIYSAEDVEFNGNAYSVIGDVRYADEIDIKKNNVNGRIIRDPSISPLVALDFTELESISKAQGNYYDEERLKKDSLPSSFWYAPGIPNVVYVDADLKLNGNIATIGGFFVVRGDEVEINGRGQIEGAIYTQEEFEINGGGGNLNVNGGVWAGEEVDLNGNASVAYNSDYMSAIRNLNIKTPHYQITSWKDTQNPYPLTP